MRIALYQPDIPQNTGAIMRLGACLDVGIDIIEPCGFVWDDRRLRRAGMDYMDIVRTVRHSSWSRFQADRPAGRLILLTTKGAVNLPDMTFRADDILLLGRESAGVPGEVHAMADERVRIPMVPAARSLNVAMSAAIVAAEALRQTGLFPQGL